MKSGATRTEALTNCRLFAQSTNSSRKQFSVFSFPGANGFCGYGKDERKRNKRK